MNGGTLCLTCLLSNPVNPANGNKVQQQLVYRGLNGFELALTYNSYAQLPLRFGQQWRDTFNRSIAIENGTAIDLGVTGAPETFVIDAKGRIRYKQIGPIDDYIWQNTLKPMIAQLEAEK